MRCKVVFSPEAAMEVKESFEWYEWHVGGLGRRFIDLIDLTIDLILLNPEGFPRKIGSYREAALKKFPYQIIYEYRQEKQTVYILHVFNTYRNPDKKYIRK